jgi:catechol 2,3-dioxygenase-like lactoylglutathione lyase family enzyme
MSTPSSPRWVDACAPSLDRQHPYLRIFKCTVFVSDQDRSLRFYLDQLGFKLIADTRFESGDRWVAVAPPDGSTILVLVAPKPDSEEFKLIGRVSEVAFLTEDVHATFEEWRKFGVRFHHPPQTPAWGGMFTMFEDVDGNSFGLLASTK